MLSSHHGKSASSPSSSNLSTENARPYCSNNGHNRRESSTDCYGSKSFKDESIEQTDAMENHQLMLRKSNLKRNNAFQQSPRKQFANAGNKTTAQQIENSLAGLENAISSATRLQRADLTVAATDLVNQRLGGSPLVFPAPLQQLRQQPQQQQHPHSARSAVSDNDFHWNTPPANCKMPNPNLFRRASLAAIVTSPPPSAGLVKSAANHGIFSSRDINMGDTTTKTDLPKQKVVQKRLNNFTGPSRRHSVPNLSQTAMRQTSTNNNSPSSNKTNAKNPQLQRMAIGAYGTATDGSYLPTPTDSAFHGSINGESSQFPDFSTSTSQNLIPHFPPTPVDAYFASGVHPFDLLSGGTGALDTRANNGTAGMPPVPPSMSTTTKSATIQYLQQLQQSMILPDGQCAPNLAQQSGQQLQPKQQKTAQPGSQ
ncbi:hypothetical protein BGX23_003089 [Mortierella sp. AD031]|nr:hypothetical protein BGX23_003089 [Mortierella sp. AD031]